MKPKRRAGMEAVITTTGTSGENFLIPGGIEGRQLALASRFARHIYNETGASRKLTSAAAPTGRGMDMLRYDR
ncbi:hypothetical protein [Salaquimonas pukyongi]|uniref:hypothetical protein n=1 Tax=Salaquimonas pukyongi TaxID=2712698 RepID=UPI0012EC31B0|nr:hypothetical protein [Salaquimonas pukyongi]